MLRREFLRLVASVVFGSFIPLDFLRRRTLHMWSNEFDFVIAETAEEAHQIWINWCDGEEPLPFDECGWEELNPDSFFTFIDCNYDYRKIKKRVREFISERGKGYFACSEY